MVFPNLRHGQWATKIDWAHVHFHKDTHGLLADCSLSTTILFLCGLVALATNFALLRDIPNPTA